MRSAKKTIRHPKRLVKKAGPFLAAGAGNFFFGPMGGLAFGAAHGAASRNSHHRLGGALEGLGKGMLYNELASLAADRFGVPYDSFLGRMAGAHKPSLLNQIGLVDGARDIGGGSGLFGGYGQPGVIEQGLENGFGWRDSLLGKTAQGALGAAGNTALDMMTGGRQQPEQEYQEDMYQDGYDQNPNNFYNNQVGYNNQNGYDNYHSNGNDYRGNPTNGNGSVLNNEYFNGPGKNGSYNVPNDSFKDAYKDGLDSKSIHERHKDRIFKKEPKGSIIDEHKKKAAKKKTRRYAAGGLVKGYNTSGRADDIDTIIPEGAYVMNATDVSLLGDGSTNNGAKRLTEFEAPYLRSSGGSTRGKGVRALLSNDEYIISPHTVNALGNGNNKVGANILNTMRDNLRKHKGVNSILPPASRSIASYMR